MGIRRCVFPFSFVPRQNRPVRHAALLQAFEKGMLGVPNGSRMSPFAVVSKCDVRCNGNENNKAK